MAGRGGDLFTLMNNQAAALEKLGGIETNDETVRNG